MDSLPPKVTPATVVRGFDAAYGRLIVALEHEQDPEDVFIALFETLNWADLLLTASLAGAATCASARLVSDDYSRPGSLAKRRTLSAHWWLTTWRVFAHIRAAGGIEGDDLDNKVKRIRQIQNAGFDSRPLNEIAISRD